MVRQSLLYVRLPLPVLWYHDHHLRIRHHHVRILPLVRRELSLAVESIRKRGSECLFRIRKRIDILDFQAEVLGTDERGPVCGV